jgi:hypothetical protein
MARKPLEEKALYDDATDLVETAETVLPRSTIGMQARKKALRELRVTPAWVIREREAAAVKAAPKAEAKPKKSKAKPKKAKAEPKKGGLKGRIFGE